MTVHSVCFAAAALLMLSWAGCSSSADTDPLQQQLSKARSARDPQTRGNQLISLAYRYHDRGDVPGAVKMLSEATQAANEVEDVTSRAQLLNYLAHAYGKLKHASEVEAFVDQIKQLSPDVDARERPQVLAKLGEIYARFLNAPRTADGMYEQALTGAAELEDIGLRLEALADVLHYSWRGGNQSKVERGRELIDADLAAMEDARQRCDALGKLGETLQKMQSSDQSAEYFRQAESAGKAIEDPLSRAHGLLNLAQRLRGLGKTSDCRRVLRLARDAAKAVGDPNMSQPLRVQIDQLNQKLS